MAIHSTQQINGTGTIPTYAAATATTGDTFVPDDRTFLVVKNGSGSPINVNVKVPRKGPDGVSISDLVAACAAGAELNIGPFPSADFGDPSNSGLATVVCSSVTTVTIAAKRL